MGSWGVGGKIRAFLEFLGKPLFLLVVFLAVSLFFLVRRIYNTLLLPTARLVSIPFVTAKSLAMQALAYKKAILISLVAFLGILTLAWMASLANLPKPGELVTRDQVLSTKIYDRNGNLLFKVFRNQNRTLVKLDELPVFVAQATIAIEDAEFYKHPGFSIKGIARAIIRNITHGETSGGSTITQQLVKNALLSPEKTLLRKAREVVLAIRVETTFTKDQILEMYLNEVPFGGATYGIEEAAQVYFGKGARELTLPEAALLAGLPKAPTTYSPYGTNPQLARARQLEVLSRMVQEGFISRNEMEEGAAAPLVFAPQKTDISAPHFVMYVKEALAERYGERVVEEGGLTVITTLDLEVQRMSEKIVSEEIQKVRNLRISNGAALVTNPRTGEILAMVGSKDYFAREIDGNYNVTTAARQPGSSIKPVNYAYALESKRFTAASMISDSPITYWIPGSEPYSPRNYDNRFHGNVPLRVALGSSFNVPAVKILASYGVETMIDKARQMGITTWTDPSNYGLSLTLGGGEVRMVDMAVVYGTLANYGKRADLNPILHVVDSKGKVLEENLCPSLLKSDSAVSWLTNFLTPQSVLAAEATPLSSCSQEALDPKVAFLITNILSDNNARIPAFGASSLLVIPGHSEVAVKTGTTQNLRDNWAIGYTRDFVVATWVGNNDNTPMAYVASGVTGATPIWHRITSSLLQDKSNHPWEVPDGITQVNICPATGTLPCEGCSARTEYFISGTQPTFACQPRQEQEKQQTQPQPQILPATDEKPEPQPLAPYFIIE